MSIKKRLYMKFVQKKTDRENIEKFFLEKVSRYSHIPVDVLKSHLNEEIFLTQCAGFDSLDMLELLTELESKYDIKFSVEIEARMKTWSGQKILDELFMITNKKEPDNKDIKNEYRSLNNTQYNILKSIDIDKEYEDYLKGNDKKEDLEELLAEAEHLGVIGFVGLYQEMHSIFP